MSDIKTIRVRAGAVPNGGVTYVALPVGSTSEDAMKAASETLGFKFSTVEYQEGDKTMVDVPNINGQDMCSLDGKGKIKDVVWNTVLKDGDIVIIIAKVKGNQKIVEAGRAPGELRPIVVEDEAVVEDVLRVAGISLGDGDIVTVNGAEANTSDDIEENDSVAVINQNLLKVSGPSTVIIGNLRDQLKTVSVEPGQDLEEVVYDNIGDFDEGESVVVHNGKTVDARRLSGIAVNNNDSIVVRKKL